MKKILLALVCLLYLSLFSAQAAPPIRVLIVDGQSNHAWQLTTPVLKKLLDEAGLFQTDIATSPRRGGDFTTFKPEFAKYQVVVMNYNNDGQKVEWPAETVQAFEQFVRDGGGLVSVHSADNSFPSWLAYNQMIGIGGWGARDEKSGPLWYYKDGKLVSDTSPGPGGSHVNRVPFLVTVQNSDHPITKGLPKAWMHQGDELYNSLRGPGQNMTVLATAHSDPVPGRGTDRDEPSLMVLSYGKGRIFHTTQGHDVSAMSCVGFITTFQRGTEWAATGKVTQKVPPNFPTAESVSYRADIAAMDPSFFGAPAAGGRGGAAGASGTIRPVSIPIAPSNPAPARPATLPGAAKRLEFEVASVKVYPMAPNSFMMRQNTPGVPPVRATGNRVTERAHLQDLVMEAYGVHDYQIVGLPDWGLSPGGTVYEIEAKAEGDGTPMQDQLQQMMQSLLADRFQLRLHRETKPLPVYALVIGKNGAKVRALRDDEALSTGRESIDLPIQKSRFVGLFSLVGAYADRPVVDETGLSGNYEHANLGLNNFGLLRREDPVGAQATLSSALQDKLGLRLEPRTQQTEILVIEHAEAPSAN